MQRFDAKDNAKSVFLDLRRENDRFPAKKEVQQNPWLVSPKNLSDNSK